MVAMLMELCLQAVQSHAINSPAVDIEMSVYDAASYSQEAEGPVHCMIFGLLGRILALVSSFSVGILVTESCGQLVT